MRVNAAWARLCVFGASVFGASLAIGLSLAVLSSAADNYPNRKVRVIVPFAAGGPTDVIARIVADPLSETWGNKLYDDNMTGVGTRIHPWNGTRAATYSRTNLTPST